MVFPLLRCLPIYAVGLLCILTVGCGGPRGEVTEVDEISANAAASAVEVTPIKLAATDWPGWRGPDQNGHASGAEIPTSWSATENVLWSTDVPGRGHSSPIVIGGTVYLATALVDQPEQILLAYDRSNGELKWQTTLHTGEYPKAIHQKGTNANSTCASDGTLIFSSFLNDNQVFVSAVNTDGEIQWQTPVGAFSSKFGYAPSPVVYHGTVIVACDNFGGGYLAALNRESGEIVWRKKRPIVSTYSTPLIANVDGKDQLLISGCDLIASYDPKTGEELWNSPGTAEATCGTMLTDGELVFASGGHPKKETICVRGDGSGTVVWKNRTKIYEPSMLLVDQHLYGITDSGIAYCWEASTGKEKWKQRLGLSFSASPVLHEGLIIVPSLSGETLIFKADSETYEELSRNSLGTDTYASPAISNGKIFLRCGHGTDKDRTETLYCIKMAE